MKKVYIQKWRNTSYFKFIALVGGWALNLCNQFPLFIHCRKEYNQRRTMRLFHVNMFLKIWRCNIIQFVFLISLQDEICSGTRGTLKKVNTCPEDYLTFLDKNKRMNCSSFPQCKGQGLFYHCVKFEDGLAEVCAPRSVITGTVHVQD